MVINGDSCLTCKIRDCSILKPCSTTTLTAISNFKSKNKYGKGQSVFAVGDEMKGVYFIKSGIIKVEMHTPNGKSFIVNSNGKLVAMSKEIEKILNIKELEEYVYESNELNFRT